MALGTRLTQWWERVRGRDEEPATAAPTRNPAGLKPQAARAIRPLKAGTTSGELKLSVDGEPDGAATGRSRPGAAGFDPYSSDGGYGTPRGWDDVHRK
jgi:hypothetical protein